MRYLVPDYWDRFFSNTEMLGAEFESMIGVLLQDRFSYRWKQTRRSWDGGKDFIEEKEDGSGYAWAESKIYKANISLRVISNTLVMAIVEETVREIFIFSYSRLNQNAILHLNRFSATTGIKVFIYDDERLESCILESAVVIERYFNKYNPVVGETPTNGGLYIKQSVNSTPHIETALIANQRNIERKRNPVLEINKACTYEVILVATNEEQINFDLSQLLARREQLGLLNSRYLTITEDNLLSIRTGKGEIKSIKINFAPVIGGDLSFPAIPYYTSVSHAKGVLPNVNFRVVNIHYPPLIGSRVNEMLENHFRARVSANNQVFCFTISGKTGVGKTRFLEEAGRILFAENFAVRHLDGTTPLYQNHIEFVRHLIAQLWFVPYPIATENTTFTPLQRREKITLENVYELLYCNIDVLLRNEFTNYDYISNVLLQGFLCQRLAIVIDNVQHLQEESINLLKAFYTKLAGTSGQNVIILAFNQDDLVFSDAAMGFHMAIKENTTKGSATESFFELEDFTRDHVELFLNSAINIHDNELQFCDKYPNLSSLIFANILPRPLDLYQFLLSTVDEGAVYIDQHDFFITDMDLFQRLVKNINKRTETIYECRIKKILKQPKLSELLIFMAYIGQVSESVVEEAGFSESDFMGLVNTGILKYNNSNHLDFFHPTLEKFMLNKFGTKREDWGLYIKNVKSAIRRINKNNDFDIPLFSISEKPRSPLILTAIRYFKKQKNTFPGFRIRHTALKLLKSLLRNNIAPKEYLEIVNLLCVFSATDGNVVETIAFLRKFQEKLINYNPQTRPEAIQYFSITREICSLENTPSRLENSVNLLFKSLDDIEAKTTKFGHDFVLALKANFLNRICVCLKNQKKYRDAEKIGIEAKNMAVDAGSYWLTCLCWVDLGYIYFGEVNDKDKLLSYWSTAIDTYERYEHEILEEYSVMRIVINLIRSCCLAINSEYAKALKHIEFVISESYNVGYLYYFLQGELTKMIIISRGLHEQDTYIVSNYPIKIFHQMLITLEDRCASSSITKFYRNTIFLRAKLYQFQHNIDEAKRIYKILFFMIKKDADKNIGIISIHDANILLEMHSFFLASGNSGYPERGVICHLLMQNGIITDMSVINQRQTVFSIGQTSLPLH